MKRLIAYFLAVLLILAPVESFARTRLLTSSPVYKGTITGLRISAVDGTAFIDNANESVTALADGNHSIEIYDSSNRMLKGVLKAAGSAETLDTDLLSGFNFTSGWNKVIGSETIVDSNTFTTLGIGGIKKSILSADCLYKLSYEKSTTASASVVRIINDSNVVVPGYTDLETGSKYATTTTNYTYLYIRNASAGTTDVTTLMVEQVTTPSSSGATIVSAKAGETFNFSYKNPSFTYPTATSTNLVIIKPIR